MNEITKNPLIIGGGQLSSAWKEFYPGAGLLDFPDVDISSSESLAQIDFSQYSVILNGAAATRVDDLERPEKLDFARGVNADGPKHLANIAKKLGIPLVHISSDYVFNGEQHNHNENEPFSPLSVYGKTKAEGDKNIIESGAKYYILRSSWVIGRPKVGGAGKVTNIVKTVFDCAAKGIKPNVVNDQLGRQTYVDELVRAADFLLNNDAEIGVYNLTNSGKVESLANIWKYIYERLGKNPDDISEVSTDEFYAGKGFARDDKLGKYIRQNADETMDYVAFRPINSDLDLAKIHNLGFESEDYFTKIDEYLEELKRSV